MTQKFLIVIPAYNEEGNIASVLEHLLSMNLPADILVVNDGSIDKTKQITERYPVYLVSHPCNLGYGAALQTGFKFSTAMNYEYVLQFDSDGQHDGRDLIPIIEQLKTGKSDVVIGSRFLGNRSFHPGTLKFIAIRFFRTLIRECTGVRLTDPTSGIRGMYRKVFNFYAIGDRFPADFPDADLLIQMLLYGMKVCEVPVGNRERRIGVSMHAGLKPAIYFFKILISTLGILITYRWLRGGEQFERAA